MDTRRAADPITIDIPGGARITYGPVAGATTQGDAMLSLLRFIHRSHGSRPNVGETLSKEESTRVELVSFKQG